MAKFEIKAASWTAVVPMEDRECSGIHPRTACPAGPGARHDARAHHQPCLVLKQIAEKDGAPAAEAPPAE